MRYLNLDNHEIRELLYIRRESFIVYFFTLLLISVGSYFLFQLLIKTLSGLFMVLIAFAYTCFCLYINRDYVKELIHKQKKVYRGALSFKAVSLKNRKRKYMLNIDGRIFYVDKKDFECIQEGDIIEFHVSPSTKHVFRMEKIG